MLEGPHPLDDETTYPHDETYIPVADIYKSYVDMQVDGTLEGIEEIADTYNLSEEAVEGAIQYAEQHASESVRRQVYADILEERFAVQRRTEVKDGPIPYPDRVERRQAFDRAYEQFGVVDKNLGTE
ncbi:MAG: hypothetical protein SVU32_01655 [Candidatus Nanohaloarchaea archaeon]|nr:hypothetical protein [Candidatus Nanohaloarchaea archaeon]